jgi:hypothetical protein
MRRTIIALLSATSTPPCGYSLGQLFCILLCPTDSLARAATSGSMADGPPLMVLKKNAFEQYRNLIRYLYFILYKKTAQRATLLKRNETKTRGVRDVE